MKLNDNFDKSYEIIINSYKPLANWFSKNQDWMAYYLLTYPGCLHLEYAPYASSDALVLGRLSNAALSVLSENKSGSSKSKAIKAAIAVSKVYEEEKSKLSKGAFRDFAIHLDSDTKKLIKTK